MKRATLRASTFVILISIGGTTIPLPTVHEQTVRKRTSSKRHIVALILGSVCAGIVLHSLIKKRKQQESTPRPSTAYGSPTENPQSSMPAEPTAHPYTHNHFTEDAATARAAEPAARQSSMPEEPAARPHTYTENPDIARPAAPARQHTDNIFAERPQFNYAQEYFVCHICFNPRIARPDAIRLHCGHIYCRECLNAHFMVSKRNKEIPLCPQFGCRQEHTRQDLELILQNKQELEEFDTIVLEQTLKKTPGLKYCPNPKCGFAFIYEWDAAIEINCQKCKQTYCARCLHPHKSSPFGNNSECAQDVVDEYAQKFGAQRCPSCRAMIEKNQGCNHMTCKHCKHEFCWRCRRPWASSGGYGHQC